jgi:hypothetical protein
MMMILYIIIENKGFVQGYKDKIHNIDYHGTSSRNPIY